MLKKLVFLGTGGTIAGMASSAGDNVGYKAAQVGVDQLLAAIPTLALAVGDWAVAFEQVAQVDSKDMGWAQWRALAQRVQHQTSQTDVAALIITHGTDTLEETAFFLSQVLPAAVQSKPVVLTCAMRPASSLTPDGPQNVLDAVAVARSVHARGVLAVCAGTVHSARDVQEVHPYRHNAFDSGDAGPLAYVEEGVVRWLHACPVAEPTGTTVSISNLTTAAWPRVEIVLNHAGASGAIVRALCAPPADGDPVVRGIVVAGTGNGTIHQDLEAALRGAQQRGIRVVRTTRCALGCVVAGTSEHKWPPSIALSPVKARIALMLDLMAGH